MFALQAGLHITFVCLVPQLSDKPIMKTLEKVLIACDIKCYRSLSERMYPLLQIKLPVKVLCIFVALSSNIVTATNMHYFIKNLQIIHFKWPLENKAFMQDIFNNFLLIKSCIFGHPVQTCFVNHHLRLGALSKLHFWSPGPNLLCKSPSQIGSIAEILILREAWLHKLCPTSRLFVTSLRLDYILQASNQKTHIPQFYTTCVLWLNNLLKVTACLLLKLDRIYNCVLSTKCVAKWDQSKHVKLQIIP